jgi:glycosyltransferase involved in cell wall biosynthesis
LAGSGKKDIRCLQKIEQLNYMKRIAIIGTNGLPGNYGGWDQLVNNLTIYLKHDFHFIVYTSKKKKDVHPKFINSAQIEYINLSPNGFQSIFYDFVSMIDAVFKADILFVCGISGCIFFPFIKLFNKNIYLNPDGIEWKRKKFSIPAKIFLKISEYVGVKCSNIIIADNLKIQEYVFEKYKKNSFLIEYGGDHVKSGIRLGNKLKSEFGLCEKKYAFKVCRIEPENNIETILDAFSRIELQLILIGNWNNSKFGIDLRKNFSKYSNLILLDPIYDLEVLDQFRNNCLIYIHGHSVGGTNPSLVEAMSLGLPIIAFDVEYNRETTENKALYFYNSDDLYQILNELEIINFKFISNHMLEIAKRRYTWEIITGKYKSIFN